MIEILPVQAFLEQSRAFTYEPIRGLPKIVTDNESHLSGTFIFAFVAQAYIFAFMTIQAFAAEQLYGIWKEDNIQLQSRYPEAKHFDHLMKSDLKELKEQLKTLAELLDIAPLHIKSPPLWDHFLQVVKVTRDFLAHPSFESQRIQNIIGHALSERDWLFPSNVSRDILLHFMVETNSDVPSWIDHNTLIKTNVVVL